MIKDTMRLFLHSVDQDIEMLRGISAPDTIINRLVVMQERVRGHWAVIYSNDKRAIANTYESFIDLNILVNDTYNGIVIERSDYLIDNGIESAEPVDEYILSELFLSYTIFLDAMVEHGMYYVLCSNFPFHNMNHFSQQKAMREANRRISDGEE